MIMNPVAVEATYSATYVENYLDCVENLPDDIQRYFTRIRELDVCYRAHLRDVENNLGNCVLKDADFNAVQSHKRSRTIAKIQQFLILAQELGDEKLQVLQLLQDLIDHKTRQLDLDYKNLVSCLDHGNTNAVKEEAAVVESSTVSKEVSSQAAVSVGAASTEQKVSANGAPSQQQHSPPHTQERERDRGDKDRTERSSKRARRSRTDALVSNDSGERSSGGGERETVSVPVPQPSPAADPPQRSTNNSNTHKKTAAGKIGKKKKRKSRQSTAQAAHRDETPPPEEADPIDPDEPTYCLCDQISFGEMILCDNDLCPIEWFHFSCVTLVTKPKGKWFCPKCRGDRSNVMKPKGQFLKELERYNKEREEKA